MEQLPADTDQKDSLSAAKPRQLSEVCGHSEVIARMGPAAHALTRRRQPQHRTAEAVVLGKIAINRNTVDLVVADDRLNELITAMGNVGDSAS
jgi:hypothetical protein